jgi:hypothetical protein
VSAIPDEPLDIDWTAYNSRGTRSRVREFVTHGAIEYELCLEGGQYVIRRTDRRRPNHPTVVEAGRNLCRQAMLELWRLIVEGYVG